MTKRWIGASVVALTLLASPAFLQAQDGSVAVPVTDGEDALVQPIAFPHTIHAGVDQIDCQYCHSGTDQSRTAGIPSVEVCMGCHAQFPKEYDELEGIQTLFPTETDRTSRIALTRLSSLTGTPLRRPML